MLDREVRTKTAVQYDAVVPRRSKQRVGPWLHYYTFTRTINAVYYILVQP